jgi:type I restriction enzyme S subunit
VAKLDTLFGHLDTLKTRLDRIPQLLKDFRQKVLTQAVTGKLTEEFDNKKILEVIRKDRKQWYLKQLELSNKTGCKKPKKIKYSIEEGKSDAKSILSKDYDVAFIEEIAAKRENALKAGPFGSSLKKEFYVASGYKIYGQEQVIKGDPFYGDYYINQEKFDSLRSCEVNEGDILISLVGTIGRVLIVPAVFEKGIINPRLVKISLHELICPEYFSIYIKSPVAKELLVKMSHGGTMDVINLDILKRLPVPIPSLQEQQEIVRRVESLFAKADQIETSYQKLKAKIEQLPQALLAKAFRGELVEQLPADGDARDLLEQIKRAKEGLEKGGKSKKLKAEDEVRMVAEDGVRYGK